MKPFGASLKTLALLLVIQCLCSVGARGQSSPTAAPAPAAGVAPGQAASASSSAASSQAGGGKDNSNATGKDASKAAAAAPNQGFSNPKPDKDGKVANQGLFEDWNTLKIPTNIEYADPMPPLVSQFPEFTREFVQLTWRPWDIIDLYVIMPKGVKNPPVILYLYSFPSDTDRFRGDEFAKLATKNGFAAVGFVSAMTGQRFHDRPMKEWFVSELQESLATSVHDVQLILNYLDKREDLDMTRVGMFGDGSGASIAIMAASVDPRIRALDLFNPWGDWPDWMAQSKLIQIEDERTSYLKPEFLKRVENLDPIKYLPQLKTQRVRVQFLESDRVTPAAAKERLAAAAPADATVISYENAKAFFGSGISKDTLFDWVQAQVVTPVAAKVETGAGNPAQPAAAAKRSQR